MKTINKMDLLVQRIIALENKQALELHLIKREFHDTVEHLNPLNFLKNTFKGFITSPDTKSHLLHNTIDLATHFIAKNRVLSFFEKPIKNILGNTLMFILNKISPKKSLRS
ncbi:hypothetical protein [Flavobacterium sp.]|uniref:hypothetical protein n=1 Tax=Flavobacterium sp. TaxID=239 RepID=UPI0025E8D5B4|nr:hypothetical protein [Flavobacterium sp.]